MPDRLAFRGAFKASAEDGTNYVIDAFEVMHDRSGGEVQGIFLYRTTEGQAVKRLDVGIYEVAESGVKLRSLSRRGLSESEL
jgi:hypothetical protein